MLLLLIWRYCFKMEICIIHTQISINMSQDLFQFSKKISHLMLSSTTVKWFL